MGDGTLAFAHDKGLGSKSVRTEARRRLALSRPTACARRLARAVTAARRVVALWLGTCLAASLAMAQPQSEPAYAEARKSRAPTATVHLSDQCLPDPAVSAARRISACSTLIDNASPDDREIVIAYLSRAQAYTEAGRAAPAAADYQSAIDVANRQLDRSPGNARLLYWRGIARHALGLSRQALADYDASIAADPRNPFAFTNRGILLGVHFGQHERALQEFDRALALAPRDPDAHFNRGLARIRLQLFDGAVEDLDAAIALRPADPLARYNRAHVHLVRGRYEDAIRDYSAALELKADFMEARLGLCRANLLAGAAPGAACPIADQTTSPKRFTEAVSPAGRRSAADSSHQSIPASKRVRS